MTEDTVNELLHWERAGTDARQILQLIGGLNDNLMNIGAEAIAMVPGSDLTQMDRLSTQLRLVRDSQAAVLEIARLCGAIGSLIESRVNVIQEPPSL